MFSKLRLAHISRYINQYVSKPQVAVIGGYHGANLGDMALGLSVKIHLDKIGIKSGLQTIYNLEKWPTCKYAIIGGGAVGYINTLQRVYKLYKNNLSNVAFLGVDFNEREYPQFVIDMLKEVSFISCRSITQAQRLQMLTGRNDIIAAADIAFSLMAKFCHDSRMVGNGREKKFFVNVLPLYGTISDKKIIPAKNYEAERPELYKNFNFMHSNYKEAVRTEVENALKQNYSVESLPFTPEDGNYAKLILEGLPVQYHNYSSDPLNIIKLMSSGEMAITTRFHATVFSAKLGLKTYPMAYATKNESLLEDMGLSNKTFLRSIDLAEGKTIFPTAQIINNEIVSRLENDATTIIKKCINKLINP